jgi:hypothetical protein
MSPPPNSPRELRTERMTLALDTERAQAILHDIALELRYGRLTGQVAPLHLRSLALKRVVALWGESAPEEAERRSTIDELLELHERVKAARRGQI